MATVFSSPHKLLSSVGTVLDNSEWVEITQDRIQMFADATGDHQWIHVDPVRAKEGPFSACIAHGYLSLSLVNLFLPQMIEVQAFTHAVNVGMDRTRFPSAVVVNSKLRGTGEIVSVEEIKGAIQSIVRVTVEIEGADRPAVVVDTISRYFPE